MQRVMNEAFFNEVIARDECANLRSVYRAIEKWEDVAAGEREAQRLDISQMSDLQAHWAAQNFEDEAFVLHRTKQAMLGSFAVSIFAAVEGFVWAMYLNMLDEPAREAARARRTMWGEKRNRCQEALDVNFDDFDGFQDVGRVRTLQNCFKHRGVADSEFVRAFPGQEGEGEEIDYARFDWLNLIASVERFLLELGKHVQEENEEEGRPT